MAGEPLVLMLKDGRRAFGLVPGWWYAAPLQREAQIRGRSVFALLPLGQAVEELHRRRGRLN